MAESDAPTEITTPDYSRNDVWKVYGVPSTNAKIKQKQAHSKRLISAAALGWGLDTEPNNTSCIDVNKCMLTWMYLCA